MYIRKHPNTNHEFGKPSDMTDEQCLTLPVVQQDGWSTSSWRPAANELEALMQGGSVALQVRGPGHPVVYVGVCTDATAPTDPEDFSTLGPCAKQVVRCTLVADSGLVVGRGENLCRNPQQTCPRADMPSGQGYEKCRDICMQVGHAEEVALMSAGQYAAGTTAYIEGHTYACDNCKGKLGISGVKKIVIGAPPDTVTVSGEVGATFVSDELHRMMGDES